MSASGGGPLDDVGEAHAFGMEHVVLESSGVGWQQADLSQSRVEELPKTRRGVDADADRAEAWTQQVFEGLDPLPHPLLDDPMP